MNFINSIYIELLRLAKFLQISRSKPCLSVSLRRLAPSALSVSRRLKTLQFEPHLIGPVSTLEELDIKVLQFQNKKLAQVCLESM